MTLTQLRFSSILASTLAIACTPSDPGNATDAGTSTMGTTIIAGTESGPTTQGAETGPTATAADSTVVTAGIDGTASTGEPCNFLNCDDYPKPECDHWAQDCPESQKCTAFSSGGAGPFDAVKCVDVTGTDQPGDACTSEGPFSGIDSCIKGAMCWYVDEEGAGSCIALCSGNSAAPVCEGTDFCAISGGGELNLCLPTCDPLLQDCKDPTKVCYPINETFSCAADASGDEGQANDPCALVNVCDKGLMCAERAFVGAGCEPGSSGCCTPFCKFPDGACPNPDQQCVQYFDPMQPPENGALLDIGVCGLPD